MTIGVALNAIKETVVLMIIISGIMILPSFIVSLIINIFQAATQIQEQTLTFIPKLVITLLLVMFVGQFVVNKLAEHFIGILSLI